MFIELYVNFIFGRATSSTCKYFVDLIRNLLNSFRLTDDIFLYLSVIRKDKCYSGLKIMRLFVKCVSVGNFFQCQWWINIYKSEVLMFAYLQAVKYSQMIISGTQVRNFAMFCVHCVLRQSPVSLSWVLHEIKNNEVNVVSICWCIHPFNSLTMDNKLNPLPLQTHT